MTPELEAYCKACGRNTSCTTPCRTSPWQVGQDIVVFPGARGGGNWHGAAFNPPLGF